MSIRDVHAGGVSETVQRERFAAILEALISKAKIEKRDNLNNGNDPPNSGTLVLDATCCPANIAYPQDIDLLNQAREKAEKTVDKLCKLTGQKKPQMYCKRAPKGYLRLSKNKKRSVTAIRSAVHKQLQYIRRDIVNLVQPWVCPIVREKVHTNTEFAPKLRISLADSYARIKRLDFEPFNELESFWQTATRYWKHYGCYPERIWANKLYRNRQTLVFCKEHGTRLSAPALDEPPKDSVLSRQAKMQEYQDSYDRNVVECI